MSIATAASIKTQLLALKTRLDKQEQSYKSSTIQLRHHAELLDDSASIIELEASSLIKADRSQLMSLIKKVRGIGLLLKEKISVERLNVELDRTTMQRRIGLKNVQIELNLLKERFDGAVEALVLEFGKGIKGELKNNQKGMDIIVNELRERLAALESQSNTNKKSNRTRRAGGKSERDENSVQDATSMLRFDNDDESGQEDEGEYESDGSNGSRQYKQLRNMAEQRHSMFLSLQDEVLGIRSKSTRMQLKLEKIAQNQEQMIAWRNTEIDPEIVKLKKMMKSWKDSSSQSSGEGEENNTTISLKQGQLIMQNRVDFLMVELSTLKQRVKDRTTELAAIQKQHQKTTKTSLSVVGHDVAMCKTAVGMLEQVSNQLETTTRQTSEDLLDLWNLANQTSLDLQTSERVAKSKEIQAIPLKKSSAALPLQLQRLSTPKPVIHASVRHEMWKQRSMLTNPSPHVFQRRQYVMSRPQSAAAAGNRRSARNNSSFRSRSRLESRCE